jgi:hypothetical protein
VAEPKLDNQPRPTPSGANLLAAGRELPALLFVTDPARLRQNIGTDADRALDIVRSAGHRIVTGEGHALAEATRLAIL